MVPLFVLAATLLLKQSILQAHSISLTRTVSSATEQDSDFYPKKYQWVSIAYANHQILSVAGRKLPVPVQFPRDLVLLGSVALVEEYSNRNKLSFHVFFAGSQEAQINKWVSGFPVASPFLKGFYTPGSTKNQYRYLGGKQYLWRANMSVRGTFDWATILFLPVDMPTANDVAEFATGSDGFSVSGRKMIAAYTAVGSPLRRQKRFIEVSVFYHNANAVN